MNYLEKYEQITILDYFLISVVGGAFLLASGYLLKFLVKIIKVGFAKGIKPKIESLKDNNRYRKRLRSGNININDILFLEKAVSDGSASKNERNAYLKHKEQYKGLNLNDEQQARFDEDIKQKGRDLLSRMNRYDFKNK